MTETGTPTKKQSLKDIARRVSTIPPTPDGKAPPRPRTPLDSMRPVAVSTPPEPERMNELAAMCEAAATRPAEAAKSQAQRRSPLRMAVPILGGLAVGVGAVVISLVVVTRAQQTQPMQPGAAVQPPAVEQPLTAAPGQVVEPAADEGTKPAEAKAEASEQKPVTAAKSPAETKGGPADKEDSPKEEPEEPAKSEEPKGLAGAMADAVGSDNEKKVTEPSKDEPTAAPGSMPMTPSQGQVQSALAQVRGAARGCVVEMEDASRATITFGSDGRVTSVSVGGAASGKPAASCIQAALRNARVPPFKNPSYTVGLTLRP